MESLIIIAFVLLALFIVYLKAKRLVDSVRNSPKKSSCDCEMCPSSCPSRRWPRSISDINQEQNPFYEDNPD